MSQYDCPDYEYITTIVVGGTVTDCPDWQQQLTGPGGGVIPGITSGTDWAPGDFGLVGWSNPPWSTPFQSPTIFVTGTLVMWPIKITATGNVSQLGFNYVGSTTTFTASRNFIGLYSATYSGGNPVTFTLICTSAAGALETNLIAAATNGNGMIFTAIPSTAVTAGQVIYAGCLITFTGGTSPGYLGPYSFADIFPSNSSTYKNITSAEWVGPYTALPSSVSYASAANPNYPFPFVGVY